MSSMKNFGCKTCGSYHVRERDGKLYCVSCGAVFALESETKEQRDARILFLARLDDAEKCLRISPPRFDDAEDMYRDFIKQYPDSSDGYWGLVRARYGIKYEIDIDGSEIPTCYMSSYEDRITTSDSPPRRQRVTTYIKSTFPREIALPPFAKSGEMRQANTAMTYS